MSLPAIEFIKNQMADSSKIRGAGRPKSLEKRMQILHHASELLLAQGYNNTSMDAVAKASGVSKQTVYSHFNNKDALYNAIIETKCMMYQIDESSICTNTQTLENILTDIGVRFIQLLNDENVIAMYNVVIGESKHDAHVAQLFYDAGPLQSVKLVTKLLHEHPQSNLPLPQANEASYDFFNLLKSDYHMPSILHLPYAMDSKKQNQIAKTVARKTLMIINLLQE